MSADPSELTESGMRAISETAITSRWLPPVFLGARVPPHPAELPLPAHCRRGEAACDSTLDERTPRRTA